MHSLVNDEMVSEDREYLVKMPGTPFVKQRIGAVYEKSSWK